MNASATVATANPTLAPGTASPERLDAVDLLRGMVMVLMALDHTRDYFHWAQLHGHEPLNLNTTTFAIYFTRWITHFCAPVFIFLAGTGAFLSGTRGKSKRALSWFLLTRGAWLIFLELTLIHWSWAFNVNLHFALAIVIWAIGWSMIALAALIHLPLWATTAIGVAMIAGHNALDGVRAQSWGSFAWLWQVLHAGGPIKLAEGYTLFVGYPLVPWIGVMAAGYGFGRLLLRPREERRPMVLWLGIALTVAFIVIRLTNLYGNPQPWTPQSRTGFTVLSFLDCAKYPPSLCYVLMTLGPALIALSFLDRAAVPRLLRPLLAFGRVPMFYYLLHIPLIHGLAVLVEGIRFGSTPWLFGEPFGVGGETKIPADAGFSLLGVYGFTLLVVALLYPACAWFAALKRRRRDAWLSYL
jgi:uncharacterized membrane protein